MTAELVVDDAAGLFGADEPARVTVVAAAEGASAVDGAGAGDMVAVR